jgi:hypothetical protein
MEGTTGIDVDLGYTGVQAVVARFVKKRATLF